jgi:Xaa-Pro aminopeptidase
MSIQEFEPSTPIPLVNRARARDCMARRGLDALVGSSDENLNYLSGHAPDSVLNHFFDAWSAAVLPRHEDVAPCLVTSEYDAAYLVTHPTWMPEIRFYGAEWSSAAGLLQKISEGEGVDTELRPALRRLYARTRDSRQPSLAKAVATYLTETLPSGRITVAFDDLRLAAAVGAEVGERLEIVDGHWHFRWIRQVKTEPEIALLRQAALINETALSAAVDAISEGKPWSAMVKAYRTALAGPGAKPGGERGMLFGAGPDGGFVLDHDYVEAKRFYSGDAVVLDAISSYRLYHADMARTAVVGEPSARQLKIFAAVTNILEQAEAALMPGRHTGKLTRQAEERLRGHGLDPRLATLVFHPIGLNIFDYGTPEAALEGWELEVGNVLNFEVFYRDPEAGGIHLEDAVVIGPGGISRLGELSRELVRRS